MRNLIAAFVLLAAPLAAAAQPASALSDAVREFVDIDDATVALTGVQVIDGTGRPAAAGRTILIQDGRIAAVGADG